MRNKKTPEIRFPGFTEDWEQRKLGEISEKVTEKNKNNIYSETLTNSAEFGIINQRDFFDKDISNEKNLDGYYVVRPDDFVYNPRISNLAPVGPIKRNKLGRTGVMSPLYYVFRTHNVNKTYLEKYFSSNSWHIFMKLNGDSGARSDRFAIKDSLFREMPIPFPSIEEQTEISNFLKKLDDTIALHEQELTILKQTKQGFLQKMFPKEGESVPEVRFPGFNGDWEHWKADEIFYSVSDKNHSNLPVLSASQEKGMVYRDEIGIDIKYDEKSTKNYKRVLPGQFVIHLRSFQGGFAFSEIEGITSPAYTVMDFKNKKMHHPLFWKYVFSSDTFIKRLEIVTYGIRDGRSISFSDFSTLKFRAPSYNEQLKVGNFLRRLEEIISLHERELDALKETKKAFLRKMFV